MKNWFYLRKFSTCSPVVKATNLLDFKRSVQKGATFVHAITISHLNYKYGFKLGIQMSIAFLHCRKIKAQI